MWWIWIVLAAAKPSHQVCSEAFSETSIQKRVPQRSRSVVALREWMHHRRKAFPTELSVPEVIDWFDSKKAPPKEPMALTVSSMQHPFEEGVALVKVEAMVSQRPRFFEADQNITLVIDKSASMEGATSRALPILQDEALRLRTLKTVYKKVSRLELAKRSAHLLVDRLPPGSNVTVIGFDKNRAVVVLPATPISKRQQLHDAIESDWSIALSTKGPIELAYDVATAHYVPCGDDRVFLLSDEAIMLEDFDKQLKRIERWSERGIQLWSMSIGLFGGLSPQADTLVEAGKGAVVRVDTLGDARDVSDLATLELGAVLREPMIQVTFDGPFREVGATEWQEAGAVSWQLPQTLGSLWSKRKLYEVKGHVEATFSVASPSEGEWKKEGKAVLEGDVLPYALASLFIERLGDPTVNWTFDELSAKARTLPAKGRWAEVRAWIDRAAFDEREALLKQKGSE